ncbi:RNA-binding S4 domain-containing protein [bacterium]|nr:RNA-binding S4 domain-containing protein [bacterium]
MKQEALETVRLDRWLNAARFCKTRSQAGELCRGRKVKVNGKTAKPHTFLKIGDRITLFLHGTYRSLEVTGLAQRGLPAKEARLLYREDRPEDRFSGEERELIALAAQAMAVRPRYKGRPTKRERRKMDREKSEFHQENH